MAGFTFDVTFHKKDGTTHSLTKSEVIDNETITIQNILDGSYCISIGCTALSQTSGGTALSGSTQVYNANQGTFITNLYDVTPEATAETITGFYLDGTEYQFAGGGDVVDDTALSSSWDGDTTHAPSKNAVYDAIGNIETLLAAL